MCGICTRQAFELALEKPKNPAREGVWKKIPATNILCSKMHA